MAAGPPDASGTEMDLPLKKLPPGRYRVTWHAVSVDTHHTEGKYNFLILP
jgi:methionine-rich copper-binding protein CopC